MEITNIKVYDLEEAVVASGLPMKAGFGDFEFYSQAKRVRDKTDKEDYEKNIKRADRLAASHSNSGHCNFLSGVLVSFNMTATIKFWEQFQRYHFKQIVSSQSTMHKLESMLKDGTASFIYKTDIRAVQLLYQLYKEKAPFETLVYSCPLGLQLTARISTNYLQLKTIYKQRKGHKLEEWEKFCNFIEELPYSYWITDKGDSNDRK